MTPYDYIENPIICLDFRIGFIIRSTVFETNEYAHAIIVEMMLHLILKLLPSP